MKIDVNNSDFYLKPYSKEIYSDLFVLIQKNKSRLNNSFTKMLPQNETEAKSLQFVLEKIKFWKQKKQFAFLIYNKHNKIIGHFNIREINWHKQEAELSYWIDEAYEGIGLMSAVLQTMCTWIFNTSSISRLIAKVVNGNTASEKVLLKNGFQYEGSIQNGYSSDTIAQDANQYGLEKR